MSESFKSGDKTLLSAVPKLVSTSQFTTWRLAFQTYALATGCRGILDGTIVEPGLVDITPILAAGQPEYVAPRTLGAQDSTTGTADQTEAAIAAGQQIIDQARQSHELLVRNYQAALMEEARRLLPAGTIPPSTFVGDVTKKDWEDWAKKEAHMQGALRGTVSAGVLVDIKDLTTAKAMWDLLHATHPINTAENRASIRRDLSMIVLTDTSPKGMEKHLERFNSIILRSQEAGNPIAPAVRAQMFADTLPQQLESLRTLWGINSPLLTELTAWPTMLRLYNEEIDRRRRNGTNNTAMAITNGGKQKKFGSKGGQKKGKDQKGSGAQQGQQGQKETRTCYNCDKVGHLAAKCRAPKRERNSGSKDGDQNSSGSSTNYEAMATTRITPTSSRKWMWDEDYYRPSRRVAPEIPTPSLSPPVEEEKAQVELAAFTAEEGEVSVPDSRGWLVDSGASNHLTPSRNLLSNIRQCDPPVDFGTASSKSRMTAREMGQATIELDNGQMATLFPVYLVPNARLNLLSVSSATAKGWQISLSDTMGQLFKGHRRLTFSRFENHWYIPPYLVRHEALAATGPTSGMIRSKLEEEHRRLGHIGRTKLEELAKAGQLQYPWEELKEDNFKSSDCPTCQSWKAVRPPKDNAPKHPLSQGMLLHVDIAGPFDPSRRLNRWLVVIIDDYSDAIEVVPTRHKSEAFNVLRDTATRWGRQFGNDVRVIRSDGDSVFQSEAANLWYKREGIRHHVTPRYTAELNGKAERTIRTIKDGIRAMLGGSSLGHQYFDYAAQYFAVIHNKTTVIPESDENVWEVLTMRHPNLHTVRQFGQVNYVQIPSEIRHKNSFDTKSAMRCRILGQDPDVSGWIVLVEATNEIIRSRDVKPLTGSVSQEPEVSAIGVRTSVSNEEEMEDDVVIEGDDEEAEGDEDVGGAPDMDDPLSDVSADVFTPPTPHFQIPISFERVKGPIQPGYDESTQQYVDKTGIIVTESLIDQLKDRNQKRLDLTDEEKGLLQRWKHYQLSAAPEAAPPQEESLGRGQRKKVPSSHIDGDRWYGRNARIAYLASESALGVTTASADPDPTTYQQATSSSNVKLWQPAIDKELDSLRAKKVFRPCVLPKGRKAISCRWIFTTKRDAAGIITKRKARLVARGFSQQPGVDFEDTFAPVSRLVSLRLLLTMAATLDWEIHQADVEGAYLNGKIKEEIYMEVPPGYKVSQGQNCVKIDGALYGLKQAAQCWWEEVGRVMKKLGFQRLESEWGLYYRGGANPCVCLLYVDDYVIISPKRSTITTLLSDLRGHWTLTDTSNVSSILGMKVDRERSGHTIRLTQPGYIDTLLARFPLSTTREFATPLPFTTDNLSSEAFALTPYQQVIGSLMWIAGSTRPDIAYAVNYLSRYSSKPTEGHWQQALRVVSYLGSTRDMGLKLGGRAASIIKLEGWVDADWGGCLDTRKSTTGYVFTINGSIVAWSSRRQQTVASSTLHAEYIALSEAAKEAAWLRSMLGELGFAQKEATVIHCDNQGAMFLAKNPTTHARTKHIDIRHHVIRQMLEDKVISLLYTKTEDQLADIFTKALAGPRHLYLLKLLGMSGTEKRSDVIGARTQLKATK